MRALVILTLAAGVIAVCISGLLGHITSAANAFPQAGTYDLVKESLAGRTSVPIPLDASTPARFEELIAEDAGSSCRNKKVSIRPGEFEVTMICDAPDGDIRNIIINKSGTYSKNTIIMQETMYLWGRPIRTTSTYRRRWWKHSGSIY
jgi:hypothetical protein